MKINKELILITLMKKQMSQSTLAELSGVSNNSISRIVNSGTAKPEIAGKIASALNIKPEELIQ